MRTSRRGGRAFIALIILLGLVAKAQETKQTRFYVAASIGMETAKEEKEKPYQFSSILSADFDAQGNIYVLDYKETCVKVFTKTGEFIRKILKPGQGPEEISNPFGLGIQRAKKRIFVLHQHGFQIKEFDEAGNFVRSHPLPEQVLNAGFGFIDDRRLLLIGHQKYGEKSFSNLKIFSLETNKIEREFAPTGEDLFTGLQRLAVKDRIVWTCPGDLMKLEAYDLETGKKLKTIPLAENYIPYRVIKWGDREGIQKIRLFNYAQPFLLGEGLYVFVTRQSFTKEPLDVLDSPLKREIKLYRLVGDRLGEAQGLPGFDFFPEFLASWENKILVASSGYDLYPRLKVLELR
jgi:hypothetical protein